MWLTTNHWNFTDDKEVYYVDIICVYNKLPLQSA